MNKLLKEVKNMRPFLRERQIAEVLQSLLEILKVSTPGLNEIEVSTISPRIICFVSTHLGDDDYLVTVTVTTL